MGDNERVRFLSSSPQKRTEQLDAVSPTSGADCETSVTRSERETRDPCADSLKDILVETRGEAGNSLGVPHRGTISLSQPSD